MSTVSFMREIPLRYDVDVFIAGGGPAGCAAAIAAARQGANVFLAESQACLGGLGTAGLVPAYMCFGDGEHFLAAGLGEEILHRLWKYEGGEAEQARSFSIHAESLKRVYEDMLCEAGADFTFGTTLIGVQAAAGSIEYCILSGKSGIYGVKAHTYIDCTGDADLAAWSGVPFEKGDEQGRVMPSTLCSLWTGIDFSRRNGPDGRAVEQAYADGVFEKKDLHLSGIWQIRGELGGGNIGHAYNVDGTDERSLTDALVYTRRLYDQYEEYYRKYLDGFKHIQLVATGALMGIRESRRICGEYTLVLQDFIDMSDFDDEIGRYCYNVDIHPVDGSDESYKDFVSSHTGYRYKRGQNYGVPYRILVPQKVDNLLVAGRCVSTDRPMQSSIRVMPGCYITGQAAGVAAALCAKANIGTREVDIRELQRILKEMGMYLPNFKH